MKVYNSTTINKLYAPIIHYVKKVQQRFIKHNCFIHIYIVFEEFGKVWTHNLYGSTCYVSH